MEVTLNLNLTELPPCSRCKEGQLIPIQDITQDGKPYLKGWFCSKCEFNLVFKGGELIQKLIKKEE